MESPVAAEVTKPNASEVLPAEAEEFEEFVEDSDLLACCPYVSRLMHVVWHCSFSISVLPSSVVWAVIAVP
jgi:hypothetical protein